MYFLYSRFFCDDSGCYLCDRFSARMVREASSREKESKHPAGWYGKWNVEKRLSNGDYVCSWATITSLQVSPSIFSVVVKFDYPKKKYSDPFRRFLSEAKNCLRDLWKRIKLSEKKLVWAEDEERNTKFARRKIFSVSLPSHTIARQTDGGRGRWTTNIFTPPKI